MGCKTVVCSEWHFGTVSILVGIDLHWGHIFSSTEDRHRSVEFIVLLNDIDAWLPQI